MSSSVVRRAERDGVITLTPNRPSRFNAITPDLLRALTGALQSAAVDDVAAVLRGEGRAFCACDLIIAGESARFGFPEAGVSMAVTNGMPTR